MLCGCSPFSLQIRDFTQGLEAVDLRLFTGVVLPLCCLEASGRAPARGRQSEASEKAVIGNPNRCWSWSTSPRSCQPDASPARNPINR